MKKAGNNKRKHVIYLNSMTTYNYLTHKGIVNYAMKNNWTLSFASSDINEELLARIRTCDGMICQFNSQTLLKPLEEKIDIPLVGVTSSLEGDKIKNVLFDNISIGRIAGDFLINKGYRRIFFVCSGKPTRTVRKRMKGIRDAAEGKSIDAECVSIKKFTETIKKRELPFAVILANDYLAQDVFWVLAQENIQVPLDVSVLGINNNPLYCDTSWVPLSSVKINSERRGMIAAECLENIMNGLDESLETVYIQPEGIEERASTDIFAIPHKPTVKALQYIQTHKYDKTLSVNEIAKHSGVCRRRLERKFKEILNRSIFNEILRLRIGQAISLIKESRHDMAEIADLCGFSSNQSMSRIFKRKLNRTPSSFKLNQ